MRTPELPRRHAPRRLLLLAAGLLAALALVTTGSLVVYSLRTLGRAHAGEAAASLLAMRAPLARAAAPENIVPSAVVPSPSRTSVAPGAPKAAAPKVAVSRRPSMLDRLLAPGRFAYHETVRRIAARYRVEHRLVMAIIASESGGDPEALSPAGAIGLMQLMPETAERLGVDPWDPEQNVEGAVRYLAAQLSTFKSVDLSLVAYNAGPGFAEKYRRGHVELGAETRDFITRVGKMLQPAK